MPTLSPTPESPQPRLVTREQADRARAAYQEEIIDDEQTIADARQRIESRSVHNLFELDPALSLAVAAKHEKAMGHPVVSRALKEITDVKDWYTWTHTQEATKMAIAIGYKLGLDEEILDKIAVGGLLHDIGKIAEKGTPMRSAIDKPGELSDEEYEIVKQHVEIGYQKYFQMDQDPDPMVGNIIRYHHRFKRKNPYPENANEELSEQERIMVGLVSAGDVAQSLASRSYVNDGIKLSKQELYYELRREIDVDESIFQAVHSLLGLDDSPEEAKARDTSNNVGHIAVGVASETVER